MGGMKRTWGRFVIVTSAAVFVVLLIGWLASLVLSFVDNRPRWAEPYLAWRTTPQRAYVVAMTRGGLSFERRDLPWAPKQWPPTASLYDPDPTGVTQTVETASVRFMIGRFDDVSLLGFEKGHWDAYLGYAGNGGQTHGAYVAIPIWFLLLATGFLPGRATWRAIRARRQRAGLCRACGYDLRASPERCPECGTPRRVGLLTRLRGCMRWPALPLRLTAARPAWRALAVSQSVRA
jgi:hypothetical protein